MKFQARDRQIHFPRRPLLMGIVNINDDSFCLDGTLEIDQALCQAAQQATDGADIIDIGAESARTNRKAISPREEVHRLRPFLEAWPEKRASLQPRDSAQVWPPLMSVNTWRPEVVEHVLPFGVDILNDIGGLAEPHNAILCARHQVALLIMHTIGLPKQPHFQQAYKDVLESVLAFFDERIAVAEAHGLNATQLILDPGIDFAKQRDDNLRVFRDLDRLFKRYDSPVLLPISRKTVIGEVLDLEDPNDRDAGTIACLVSGVLRGASMFRVHHVRAMFEALKVLWAVQQPLPD